MGVGEREEGEDAKVPMLISPAAASALGRHQPLHIKQAWILKRNIYKMAKYLHNSTLKDKIGKNDKNLYLDRSFVTFSGGTQWDTACR